MPDTVKNGELGQENGLTFSVGSTQICKIIETNSTVSIVSKITFKKDDFAKPGEMADGLITFKVGKTEDLSSNDNILTKGVPDVYFSVRKQTIYLNLELPVDAVKHTTGFMLARKAAVKKRKATKKN